MNGTEQEQKIKTEMALRSQPDSFEISVGSAAKGQNVTLKCYADFSEIAGDIQEGTPDSLASKKIKGLLKIRQYLAGKGLM